MYYRDTNNATLELVQSYRVALFGAGERTRTFTRITPHAPEACASTNSATPA